MQTMRFLAKQQWKNKSEAHGATLKASSGNVHRLHVIVNTVNQALAGHLNQQTTRGLNCIRFTNDSVWILRAD